MKFPHSSEATITKYPTGAYVVSAWVESKNPLGVPIRTEFEIEVRLEGNEWHGEPPKFKE